MISASVWKREQSQTSRKSLSSQNYFFFFSSRRRHTRLQGDWSSDVCSSDLFSEMHGPQTGRSRSSRTRTVAFSGIATRGSSSTPDVLFVAATVHRRLVDADDLVRARDAGVAEIAAFFGQRVSTLNRHSALATRRSLAPHVCVRLDRPLHRSPRSVLDRAPSLHTAWRNVDRIVQTGQAGKSPSRDSGIA